MDSRPLKQLTVAAVFVAIAVAGGFLFWRSLYFQQATCTDNIQNQNEVGVDCGGVCPACVGLPQTLKLSGETAIVAGEDGTVDVLFRIENVNPQWGARSVAYTIELEDAEGTLLATRQGSAFLLPLEEHAVVEQFLELAHERAAASAQVTLAEPRWVEVPQRIEGSQLTVLSPMLRWFVDRPEVAEVVGIIRNDSPFTYDRIDVFVIVSDAQGTPVGVRRTDMRTLSSGERREFRVAWRAPFSFFGEPKLEIVPLTNLFENENFVRAYGTVERFQELR